jgi:hypothetical protein
MAGVAAISCCGKSSEARLQFASKDILERSKRGDFAAKKSVAIKITFG